jgi:CheY-like chemotaxis protein
VSNPFQKPWVIVAEARAPLRQAMCELLSRFPVEVSAARNGHELVMLVAGERPLDLLVADVGLPGMSGLEVATLMRRLGFEVPIVLVAAHPDDKLAATIAQLGRAQLLTLPFSPDELLALVRPRFGA